MIDAAARTELAEVLGGDGLREHDPVDLDGVGPGVTLEPRSPEDLSAALAACAGHGVRVLVRGGGTRLGLGNRPREADAWLSTASLDPACEVDGDEGVARVSAATPVEALDAASREAGWRSPLEARDPRSTVGGAVATGTPGPRALGLGPTRRAVLGLDVALGSGEATRCGSRVVKNVSGYDLVKLYVGSLGTLGVFSAAWLRLRPTPEAERALAVRPSGSGVELARALARRPGVRAAACVDAALAAGLTSGGEGELVLAELAGDAPVVAGAEAWLRERGEVEDAPDALDRLHQRLDDPQAAPLRFRISAPASALPALWERLADAGARRVASPGLREITAVLPLERHDTLAVDEAWRAVRSTNDPARGIHAVLEQVPSRAKDGRDVFDAVPATLPLMRALKAQFDPAGILNPGRFAGGL